MQPIITFSLRRLFERSDVYINNLGIKTSSLRNVCRRQFSEERNSRMAEGGNTKDKTFLVCKCVTIFLHCIVEFDWSNTVSAMPSLSTAIFSTASHHISPIFSGRKLKELACLRKIG